MLRNIRLVALFLFFFVFSVSYAQDRIIDSLKLVLKNPKLHDTTKLRAISDVMDENFDENDKNYYYLNSMMGNLAQKNLKKKNNPNLQKKFTLWLASYNSVLGIEYSHKPDHEKGLVFHDRSIALYKSVKNYDEMYYEMVVKAQLYTRLNQDEKAIPLIFAAVKYFDKIKETHPDPMAYSISALAYIYQDQRKHDKAIEYNKQAIQYYDASYAKNPSNQTLYLKCLAYGNIAYSYASLKNYPETIVYCNKAVELAKKVGADTVTGLFLAREATAEIKLSHFDRGEELYHEVLSMKALSKDVSDAAITVAYLGLGRLYFDKKDLNKALLNADKGFLLSKKTGSLDLQGDAAHLIYDISKETKNYERALEMYKFQEKIVDSSQIEASKNELAQQQLKYDFEKKELKLKLGAAKKNAIKNNWLIGLSAVLLLLLLGGYFYYRNNKQKQAIAVFEKNQIKQKLLVTQMNPHFIFNSIDNIQSLIYNKQDKEAVNYLTKFSKLTRQILENSNENYISLEEEVEMIENYLVIQQLLYSNKFDFKIAIEEGIVPATILLPPMLTQPFIENAIKHGLQNKTEQGKIEISFYVKEAKLYFSVSDNGSGFDGAKKMDNHKSLAMTITKERLVNYTKNQDFVVQTDNLTDGNQNIIGAKVIFEIPYIYEK